MPPELHEPIIDRAQGNPLYAEEFVRLLVDRDLLVRSDGRYELREGAQIPMPDSITRSSAARLDALPSGRKAAARRRRGDREGLLVRRGRGDGRPEPPDVDADLAELARVELVRPAPGHR